MFTPGRSRKPPGDFPMKRILPALITVIPAVVMLLSGADAGRKRTLVVTTSMLECAAREILPESGDIEIFRLLPPSSCPGHFDISPRVIPMLRSAVLVLRHDYQKVLDGKLSDMGAGDISTMAVATEGTPLRPSNYLTLVKRIGAELERAFPDIRETVSRKCSEVEVRVEKLSAAIGKTAAPWRGTPIIVAEHQREFCEWLGFETAGVLKRPEDTSPRDVERLLSVKAEMVVANLQEGVQGAFSLGDRMNIPVAVLSNFPGVEGYGKDYYQLVESNVKRLEEAWRKR